MTNYENIINNKTNKDVIKNKINIEELAKLLIGKGSYIDYDGSINFYYRMSDSYWNRDYKDALAYEIDWLKQDIRVKNKYEEDIEEDKKYEIRGFLQKGSES